MSRTLAIVLAGAGVMDLAYIDVVLGPRLLSGRAEIENAVIAGSTEAKGHTVTPAARSDRTNEERSDNEPKPDAEPVALELDKEPSNPEPPKAAAESSTPAGEAVGASDQKTWLLLFPAAKQDWVPRQAEKPLINIARRIKASPNHDVLVFGHCDERGDREANHDLGERRARAIAERLVSLGIDEARIQIRSFGEERPAVNGSNGYAWSRNRRVEVVLRPRETRSLNR